MPNLTLSVAKKSVVILPIIDAGFDFALLSKNGRAWAWGNNSNTQLGNTGASRVSPVSVLGAIKTFCRISADSVHSLAIDKNGRVWAWGSNSSGELGDNTITQRATPVSVAGAVKTFCKISAGNGFSMAIDKNGRAWGWGSNSVGNIGDNTIVSKRTPVSVLGTVKTFCEISAFGSFSIAIDKNGRAWAWGLNTNGQLGDNSVTSRLTPVSILGTVKTFCKISVGNFHSLAIDKNGRAWAWGANTNGQLGDNSVFSQRTPISVLGTVKTFCQISGGGNHSVAVDKNGRAWAWGLNTSGQLGSNSGALSIATPVSVAGTVKTFCQISAGSNHSIAVDNNGKVWAWGLNTSGQLGNNNVASRLTPVSVQGTTKTFCNITAGKTGFSLGIDKNGRAWGWGNDFNGQLGDNSNANKFTPVSVLGGIKTFCKISGGSNHTLSIDKNGRAWAWGANTNGTLGDNTITLRRTPVSVLGAIKTFCQISAGSDFSVAIEKNGRLWSWGSNGVGQLGDNTIVSKRTPVSVLGTIKTFCKISAGNNGHSLSIDKNGRVWAWGFNNLGQLGDNTITSRLTPVSILGTVKTFCQISAGNAFSQGIDKNGRAWAWGTNNVGQLGDNTTASKRTPVSVLGTVKTFCQISAGDSHSLAIDKNGRVWAWGTNTNGQLGDNTTTLRLTPVSVTGAIKTFCQIAGGDTHSLAIDKNGRVWAWGLRTSGQLGDSYASVRTPVMVCNI